MITNVSSRLLIFLFLLQTWSLSASTPQRIVSIAPSFTEILFALGVGPHVVGTTNYCDYPSEALKTAKIGDLLNPNIERIVDLHPDLVLLGGWKWQVPEKLRSVGIRVVEIKDAQNVQDILDRILFIGAQVGKESEARKIAQNMKTGIDSLRQRSSALKQKPKVYVELDTGNWTAGSGSYMNEIFQIAGLQNIFEDRTEAYLMVTTESIAARDPDIVLSLARSTDDFKKSSEWESCRAVRDGSIVDKTGLDWNAITRQSPRLIDGINSLIEATNRVLRKK